MNPVAEPEEEEGRRRMDSEVRVISGMIRTLDELDPDARARVVAYLASRYKE
jgi:hypothetical protein